MSTESRVQELVHVCRTIGDPTLDLAILGEGNASAKADEGTFWVKASGFCLADMTEAGLTRVRFAPILEATDKQLSDQEVAELLMACRAEGGPKPSTETFMHAWLLDLPDVEFVAHTHPTPLLSLLCIEGIERICETRLFPDEIVCCGPATAWVPYVDPGMPLARAVRDSVREFIRKHGMAPKIVWMQNHGLIALGKTANDVLTASRMAVKVARVYLGIFSTGQPMHSLTPEHVARIHTRPDELYRQRLLRQLEEG